MKRNVHYGQTFGVRGASRRKRAYGQLELSVLEDLREVQDRLDDLISDYEWNLMGDEFSDDPLFISQAMPNEVSALARKLENVAQELDIMIGAW